MLFRFVQLFHWKFVDKFYQINFQNSIPILNDKNLLVFLILDNTQICVINPIRLQRSIQKNQLKNSKFSTIFCLPLSLQLIGFSFEIFLLNLEL